MKSRLLAYVLIILLAGYFYSDYVKAEQSDRICTALSTNKIKEMCSKGDLITPADRLSAAMTCDFDYSVVKVSDDAFFCIYRGDWQRPASKKAN